jgi:hypothetical protein
MFFPKIFPSVVDLYPKLYLRQHAAQRVLLKRDTHRDLTLWM